MDPILQLTNSILDLIEREGMLYTSLQRQRAVEIALKIVTYPVDDREHRAFIKSQEELLGITSSPEHS